MSFLTPVYLLAGLAVLGPILFHLIRKRPREIREFSAVDFLEPSPPRLSRRSRMDQWLLLLLRSSVFLLLAGAFARPYLRNLTSQEESYLPGKERILLIDTSASMRRVGIWDDVLRHAKAYIEQSNAVDSIGVYQLTDGIIPVLGVDQAREAGIGQKKALAHQAILNLQAGWGKSDHGKGILQAIDLLQNDIEEGKASRGNEIAVISDFQQGNAMESLGSIEWPEQLALVPLVCKPTHTGNASISLVKSDPTAEAESALDGRMIDQVKVLVRNSSRSIEDRFRLQWLNETGLRVTGDPISIIVPPGQNETVSVPYPTSDQAMKNGQDSSVAGTGNGPPPLWVLELLGDANDFDNRLYIAPAEIEQASVLCIDQPGVNPEASLWYFAERVNLSQGGRKVIWKLVTPDATLELGREGTLERVEDESPRNRIAWTVASRILGPQRAKDLRESIEAGGHLLWVWDRVEPGEELVDYSDLKGILDTWFGEKEVQVTESPGRQYHLLQDVNMNHPVFVSLSDPKFSDFSKVRFWRHRNFVGWDSNAWDVLANYSDGNPALLQRRLGKGLVTIMTSGWQPADSQLALSSKFVPILSGIFEQAVPEPRVEFSYCGDPVPEGRGLPVEAKNRTYESPGFYATGRSGTSIGVNVAKSEQITEPMELSEFDRFGVSLGKATGTESSSQTGSRARLLAEQLEAQQGGWWWVLATVLLLAAIESILAAVRSGSVPRMEGA